MGTPSQPRWRQVTLGISIVAAVFVAGLLTPFGRDDHTPQNRRSQAPATLGAADSGGPTRQVAGMPAGFTHDEVGATRAAAAYATASERWLYFSDEELTAAVEQISTPASAERAVAEVVADITSAREGLGETQGPVWWFVRALATRVEHHAEDEARISVWIVTVLSAEGVAAPQSEWQTLTIDLEWVDGDWKVDDIEDAPGPTPMTGPGDRPWDAQPFDDALDGFARLDRDPVR